MRKLEQQGLYFPEYEHDNCGAGFICSLEGKKSNDIIHKALEILDKLEHRGAVSADGKTGDGAGILIDIPHEFFTEECDFELPEAGQYAVANVFLPQKSNQREFCVNTLEENIKAQGLHLLGWRAVPVNKSVPGRIAAETEPYIAQIFIGKSDAKQDIQDFNRHLFIARKKTEHKVYNSKLSEQGFFYIPSLSTKIIIFKGLLMPEDISLYYRDLQDPRVVTRLALVHQRFSTNTFPTWDLAQPFRYMCHNGEINTLRGNVSRMRSREELLKSDLFGDDIKEILPIILPNKSDSATLDMVVELLLMTGRSLPEVMMILVPEAWEKNDEMSEDKKAFYEYHSCMMEPWDGPASIPFTDGNYIGAVLDRNGLRPSRYSVTKDGYVIMSSETGVVDIEPANVELHGRLEPGKMFLVNMAEGRIIQDEEVKEAIAKRHPYKQWVDKNLVHLKDIPYNDCPLFIGEAPLDQRKVSYGYTREDINTIIMPMAESGKEPIGSMGTDTPIAVLSERPQLVYNYFQQLFAQVTNPPLDGIREEMITDISLTLGSDQNIFEETELHCRKLKIQNPVISKEDLDKIKNYDASPDYKVESIQMLYNVEKGHNGLEEGLQSVLDQAEKAIDAGANIIILSDRYVSSTQAAIPALLACSFVNSGLQKLRKRSKASIIIESAEPREVHHFALLFGYGASAINPYLVNEIIAEKMKEDDITEYSFEKAIENYNKAVGKGILKVMNKMGVSTLNSYRGSQLFECIGLNSKVVEKYFPRTTTRIQGIGLYELEKEINKRHQKAFATDHVAGTLDLEIGGDYRWRRDGEKHMLNPLTVAKLQKAVRSNEKTTYKEYADLVNEQSKNLMTIRGLLEFSNFDPIPLDEVEPWTEIVKRFKTGAMSYGSISQEAHENLAIAMNRIGGKSNSGEGGENPLRFYKTEQGDWKNSAIKQVASGRFGVSSNYLTNAAEIQIKMAQGAKPGEGGQLPGPKVNPEIAKTRNSTPYVGLISPPPHHDIYSIEDLAQLIYDLKQINPRCKVTVKLVAASGVGTIAAGVAKAEADVILISGHNGGTGASPATSIKFAGLPWEMGLTEAHQVLAMNNLRDRITLRTDGGLRTGRDIVMAAMMGAEEYGIGTAALIAMGCIMVRQCQSNTCPVGVCTQDEALRGKFTGNADKVVNLITFYAQEVREILASIGARSMDEIIGRADLLSQVSRGSENLDDLDLNPLLITVDGAHKIKYNRDRDRNAVPDTLDAEIVRDAARFLNDGEKMQLSYAVQNTHRTVGTRTSSHIVRNFGMRNSLQPDHLTVKLTGSAGQSLGAFAAPGLKIEVSGDANDYVGKGLSGGTIVVRPPMISPLIASENTIIGNTVLYGATDGHLFAAGRAGERFAVRNSGAKVVVEGCGSNGCEYMTGGIAVILGSIGANFGAGMTGGMAYLYDPENQVEDMLNMESLVTCPVSVAHWEDQLKGLIERHVAETGSQKATEILRNWDDEKANFVQVCPKEMLNKIPHPLSHEKSAIPAE